MFKIKDFFSSTKRNKAFKYGLISFMIVLLLVFILPLIMKLNPNEMTASILSKPFMTSIFGTDQMGRDLFSRIIYGGRTSILIGGGVMLLTGLFGTLIGLLAGYYERVDIFIMRFLDVMMSFPPLLLGLSVLALMGDNIINLIIALSIVYIPRTTRVVRSVVLTIKEKEYVVAARAIGASDLRIILKHVFVSTIPALAVQQTFIFAYAILGEASLSFVGVGIQPPTPSWGNILSDARQVFRSAPWMVLLPSIFIGISVLSLNILGDGLREILDPKRKIK